jgi:hypothetical protein
MKGRLVMLKVTWSKVLLVLSLVMSVVLVLVLVGLVLVGLVLLVVLVLVLVLLASTFTITRVNRITPDLKLLPIRCHHWMMIVAAEASLSQ